MFLIRLVLLPIRLALGSLVVGYKAGSLLGYRRLLTFAVGVGVGLLIAPVPGRQLRERLEQRLRGAASGTDGLLGQVRHELAQSPRTWHLPQPDVALVAGQVVLTGEVPHDVGRADLERAAASVPGVIGVDNRLVVRAEPTLVGAAGRPEGPGDETPPTAGTSSGA